MWSALPRLAVARSTNQSCRLMRASISTSAVSSTAVKHRILSGIQPTGVPHLGNYLGALQNWARMQDGWMVTGQGACRIDGEPCEFGHATDVPDPESVLYSIVDLHSITVPQDPAVLQRQIRECAISLLAVGLDPKKCSIFQQSRVAPHSELAWVLMCQTPMGKLNTMTQWKTKKQKADAERLGLFAYPVLMAADILLYRATHVPVGDDQEQHLELCQHIASSFNNRFDTDYLVHPQPVVAAASRVMDLRNPEAKMSKSARSDLAKLNLNDSPDTIIKKIRKAVTDTQEGVTYDIETRPGVSNLVDIYIAMHRDQKMTPDEAALRFEGLNMLQFKEAVAQSIMDYLKPIQDEYNRLEADPHYVTQVLDEGADRANNIAARTMHDVYKTMGLRT